MARREDLQKRHGEMAGKIGMTPDGGEKSPSGGRRRKGAGGLIIVLLLLLLAVGGTGWWFVLRGGGRDTDSRIASAARELEQGVGLIVLIIPGEDGEARPTPIATCWAVDKRLMVTNAHVVESVQKCLNHDLDAYVAINRRPDLRMHIIEAWSHPRYGEVRRNISGEESLGFSYDVGFLRVDSDVPTVCPVADESELQRIASGYRVGYLGFPMENLAKGGVDIHNPVANMQSGIVTAVSDFWQGDAGAADNVLVRHNLGAAGGSSGSPLFNADGEVVAVLNGGNMNLQLAPAGADRVAVVRTPSAAMINFAQRVDLLTGIPPTPEAVNREKKSPRRWQTDTAD